MNLIEIIIIKEELLTSKKFNSSQIEIPRIYDGQNFTRCRYPCIINRRRVN